MVDVYVYRFSDIVAVHLINPVTFQYKTINNVNQSSALSIKFQLTATPDHETYAYMVNILSFVLSDYYYNTDFTGHFYTNCTCTYCII